LISLTYVYFKRAVKVASDELVILDDVREDELTGEGVASTIPGISESADATVNIPQIHMKRTTLEFFSGTAATIPPIATTATTSASITTTTPAAAPTAMNKVLNILFSRIV
jgi:hypothetical protein